MEYDFLSLIAFLRLRGVSFEPGLSDAEIKNAERTYGFVFPPDLRLLLQTALPVSEGFVNWRSDSPEKIVSKLDWPLEGMLFDIENSDFWYPKWGEKPQSLAQRFEVAKTYYATVPRLIPIFSHRYIPAAPHEAGNPVFSVYQTDIIHYGDDLDSYLRNEFDERGSDIRNPKNIEFWTDLVYLDRP